MGTNPRHVLIAIAAVAWCLCATSVKAQPAPVPNDAGEFMIQYTYHWFHRDMPPTQPVEKRWEVAALAVTHGVADWLTVGLNGGYWDVSYDDFPGTDYERYVVGVGLSARLHRFSSLSIIGEFQFSEVLDFDQSENEFHKSTRSVLVGVYATGRRVWRDHAMDVWAGPVYVRDVGKNYFFGALNPLKDDSFNDIGIAAGGRIDLFDRVVASAWVTYADYVQPRVSIGVRM